MSNHPPSVWPMLTWWKLLSPWCSVSNSAKQHRWTQMLQDVFSGWVQTHKTFKTLLVFQFSDRNSTSSKWQFNCTSQFNRINALPTTVHQQCWFTISKMNIKPDLLSRPRSPSRTGLDAPREKNAARPLRTLLALVQGDSCFCTHIIIINGVKNVRSIFWMFAHLTLDISQFGKQNLQPGKMTWCCFLRNSLPEHQLWT